MALKAKPSRLLFLALGFPFILLGASAVNGGTSSPAGAFVDFDLVSSNPAQLVDPDAAEIVLEAKIANVGTESDSYDIFKSAEMPSPWSASFCFGGGCIDPAVDSLFGFLTVDPSSEETFSIHVAPNGAIGGGSIDLTARSVANPAVVRSAELVAITYGTDVLLVDDEPGDYEHYYREALGDGLTVGIWPRCCVQPTFAELIYFETVIWETGESQPALTLNDQSALSQFLGNGGHLFISGQDIGWSMCDQASPYSNQAACDFYRNYLHADYQANASDDWTLSGINGDAVSHGLTIGISGGDGADNQTSPDVVAAIAPARNVFMYDDDRAGAVRAETGPYKVVYFAFGFEAINSQDMRRTVMDRILERFAYDGEKGDVDNNGSINVLDVLTAANIILTIIDPTPEQRWRADFDNNGKINVIDLIGMVNVILGG